MKDNVAPPADGTAVPAIRYVARSAPDEKGSLERQAAEVQAAIDREGGRICFGELQVDDGVSAYSRSRGKGLERAKSLAVEAAQIHGQAELWVAQPDRLARGDGLKADHLVELVFWAKRRRVALRSVHNDAMLQNILSAVMLGERAHEDSRAKSEHVKRGKRGQWDRGEPLGGPTPDGYARLRKLDGPSSYEIDPTRQPVIARLWELARSGMDDAAIMRRLNGEGHRTEDGMPWQRRRIQDTVTNPWYCGRISRGRSTPGVPVESRPGRHPQYVEPEVFDRLLASRANRDPAAGSHGKTGAPNRNHLLAKLAYCARCGERMVAITSSYRRKADGGRARGYLCGNVKHGTGLCDAPRVNAEVVEPALVEHLNGMFLDFDAWISGITAARTDEREGVERELGAERTHLTDLGRREGKLADRYAKTLDVGDEVQARAAALALERHRTERGQLEHRIAELETVLAATSDAQPVDALLDFYSGLRAAVAGRLGRDELGEVNIGLREVFAKFWLATTPHGVRIDPELHPNAPALLEWDSPDAERPTTGDPAAWARWYEDNPPCRARIVPNGADGRDEYFPVLVPEQKERDAQA